MRIIGLLIAAFLLSPMVANAAPVTYNYSGTGTDTRNGADWVFEGSFIFDHTSLVPGVNILGDIISWNVTWTNGTDSFSNSDTDSTFDVANFGSVFTLNADLSVYVANTFLCTNSCGLGSGERFTIDNDDDWSASPDDSSYFITGTGEWSEPNGEPVAFQFPIDGGWTAYTHPVTSILDHSGQANVEDGRIEAFDGTLARCEDGLFYEGSSLGKCLGDKGEKLKEKKPKKDKPFECANITASCSLKGIFNYEVSGSVADLIPSINFTPTHDSRGVAHLSYDGHVGYDYAGGGMIVAPADGVLCVATAATAIPSTFDVWRDTSKCPTGSDQYNGNYGGADPWSAFHTFYIVHENGMSTWFLHANNLEAVLTRVIFAEGSAVVTKGQPLGFVGDFGVKGNLHLHFEVRGSDGSTVDPYGYAGSPVLWE